MPVASTRLRVVIENVQPEIDAGRFPIKRVVGDRVAVEADVFGEGHDQVAAILLWRREQDAEWTTTPMAALGNDRFRADFPVTALGRYVYTVRGWPDKFLTWQRDLRKRVDAGQDVAIELLVGRDLITQAASRASRADAQRLQQIARAIAAEGPTDAPVAMALATDTLTLVAQYPDPAQATSYERELTVVVDRKRAQFSAWYELFPRSCSAEPGRHGTFRDVEARLPYVAGMGFDVLYLPPIHPIGTNFRKGKNNTVNCTPDDVGSPWGIGAREGGHTAIHPQLGTLADLKRLMLRARDFGIEIALDIAFQCSPDHPWVRDHPEWFRKRPDGTIRYAENPPKKYQDIYPIDFESDDWEALWTELKGVFLYWIEQGVRIFRVDNPHTKPFAFWEWAIDEIKRAHPDVLFLSEAFTRPRVMYRLAKLGFTQSYTYFAWRNTAHELQEYLTELTQTRVKDFFRPNFWPNTPDILTEYLQHGGRPAFMIRLLLAATLTASYGIYGPAFELCAHRPRESGSEEYIDSEKYEIKRWDLEHPDSLRDFITLVNAIRRENATLHSNERLLFHPTTNDQLLCYSKHTEDGENILVMVVNLSPYHTQSGWVELQLDRLGIPWDQTYQVHDLLSDAYYLWSGGRNFVMLDPHSAPAHVFRLRRRLRREGDFDYYQ